MFTTIITDCYEDNEAGRQVTRFNSLNLGPASLFGVGSNLSDDATLEGGINLVDMIDASEGGEGIIVLNVAPRGNQKEGENGNPFCYFYYKKTLVISSVKGYCLSFLPKFGITDEVNLLDLNNTLSFAKQKGLIDGHLESYIQKTQFRSFDFVPRVARFLIDRHQIPFKKYIIDKKAIPGSLWCIDAFGNAKTTLISSEANLKVGQIVVTNIGSFLYYNRLKDVPFGETAIYSGSSGFGDKRCLEICVQGIPGSASKKLNLKVGDKIEIKKVK